MNTFLLMIQLFTKIPINKEIEFDKDKFRKGVLYFPLVGLIVGLITALMAYVLNFIFSTQVTAMLSILFSIALTGALHWDGLADTMDGVLSARKREQMLIIMKDSRIGTHGVLALVLFVILKFLLLVELNDELLLPVIFVLPVVGKTAIALTLWGSQYARKEGLGDLFIGKTRPKDSIGAGIISLVIIYIALGVKGILALLFVILISFIIRRKLNKILGGMTGDTLGAINEIAELLFIPLLILLEKAGALL